MEVETAADSGEAAGTNRRRWLPILRAVVAATVAVLIFALIIPKIASYQAVWQTIAGLTALQLTGLVLATIFNLFTYWWQMMAAMPGLSTAQAAVNNQTGTTISNILPGGGIVALGVVMKMFRSWGFSPTAISLELSVTGIWNSFLKLGLPLAALGAVALTGVSNPALVTPAVIGLLILVGCVLLFALTLWKRQFALAIGARLGQAMSWVRALVRKPPLTDWGDRATRFRSDTMALISKRWIPLTVTTILSHLALYFVLLLALRDLGVTNSEVSWAEVLAVFASGRLITALPITPGGVGLVEVIYILGITVIARAHADIPYPVLKAQVAAAVLVFRALTFGIQIPLGGFTYVIWRTRKSWLRAPDPGAPSADDALAAR